MSVIGRQFDFTPGTPIVSADVDAEFDQLVNLLNGTLTNKELVTKLNDVTLAPINADQLGLGFIFLGKKSGATVFRLRNNGAPQFSSEPTNTDFMIPSGILDMVEGSFQDAGAVETTVYTRTLKANTLSQDGDYLYFEALGTFSNAPNSKIIRVKFNGVEVFASDTFGGGVNSFFSLKGKAYRDGADDIVFFVLFEPYTPTTGTVNRKAVRTGVNAATLLTTDRTFSITCIGSSSPSWTLFHVEFGKGGK